MAPKLLQQTMFTTKAAGLNRALTYALSGFSTPSYYKTSNGAGDAGVSTNWGFCTIFYLRTMPGVTSTVFSRASSGKGWQFTIASSDLGPGMGATGVTTWRLGSNDIGKIHALILLSTGGSLRAYINRIEWGTAAFGSYATDTGPTCIGAAAPAGATPVLDVDILSTFTFTGSPTLAQVEAIFDAIRLGSAIPNINIVKRWDLIETLASLNMPVAHGDPAPTTLPELVAGAATDKMTLSAGGTTIAAIDFSAREGRKTYGLVGFDANNQFKVSNGWIGSSSGFHLHVLFRISRVSLPALQRLVAAGTAWLVSFATGAPAVTWTCGSTCSYTIPSRDLGRWLFATFTYEPSIGTKIYFDGTLVASNTYNAASFNPAIFYIGSGATNNPASDFTLGFVSCSNTIPSPAQVKSAYEAWRDNRTTPVPPDTSTGHLYDLGSDIKENAGIVPTTFKDRVGTQPLDSGYLRIISTANGLRGIGPSGYGNGFISSYNAGIRPTTSGFHVIIDAWYTVLPGAGGIVVDTAGVPRTSGYYIYIGNGIIMARTYSPSTNSSQYTITSGDLNKRIRVLFQYTGTALRLYVNSSLQVGADVNVSMTTNDLPMIVGDTLTQSDAIIEAVSGGSSVLTSGEISALFSDLTKTIPITPGKTQKHYLLEQDISEANGNLPTQIVERISGVENLKRIQQFKVAQTVERQWAWESP